MAGKIDGADMGRLPGNDVKDYADLLSRGVGRGIGGDPCPVIPVLLHEFSDVGKSAIKFFLRVKFAELELRGVSNLVGIGMSWCAFHVDCADKKV